jgi:photosystem II stability/assembly factor-like uncharacterized protein
VSLFLNGRKRHTHYGLGVYKSTDGGTTWAATGLTFQLTNGDASLIRKVLVNPTNSNELCAAGASGMYKSINGGTTWNKVMDSLFWDLHRDPVSTNILYASTGWVMNSNQGNAGVYKSTDFGNTYRVAVEVERQIGRKDQTNLRLAHAFDADAGAGQTLTQVLIRAIHVIADRCATERADAGADHGVAAVVTASERACGRADDRADDGAIRCAVRFAFAGDRIDRCAADHQE